MIARGTGRLLRRVWMTGVLCAMLSLSCFAQTYMPELPDPGTTSLSKSQQEKLGFQAAQKVYQQMPVLPDNSPETQYVRQIGRRLVAVIPPAKSWPYEFHVVAEKDVNAFALPGGQIFINLGAIRAAANESQLAGVMAHEMSHVYMQHSAKQMQKAQFTQGLAGLAGILLGKAGGVLGQLGQTGIEVGAGMVMLKYSRTDEAQADAVGAIILYRADYNPMALAEFFKGLEAQGGTPPQILSDHPNPGNREEAIRQEIQNWPPERYRTDNAEFEVIHKEAMHAKAYTAQQIAAGAKSGQWEGLNRRNGAVLQAPAAVAAAGTTPSTAQAGGVSNSVAWDSVAPSRDFVFTDTGFLQLVRPQNWQVMAANQTGRSVTIAPSAGVAGNAVGYGVLINAVTQGSRSMSLDEVTGQIVQSFENGESGLRQAGTMKRIRVANEEGRSVLMESTSPFTDARGNPQQETDWLVTAPRPDGSVAYLVFVSPSQEFDRLKPTFERMLRSVAF